MSDSIAQRPTASALVKAFAELVSHPLLSSASVRSKAKSGTIGSPGEPTLRSLYWKIYLNVLSPSVAIWPDTLKRHRRQWQDLANDFLRAPDGTWMDGARDASAYIPEAGRSAATFDPLGNEKQNPWPAYYKDLDLRKTVRQDVERTFPDNNYFRTQSVQDMMTNVLFVFSKLHSDVGYRQGMHEILAIILWCTDLDSLDEPSTLQQDSLAHLVLSRQHLEHDSYAMFNVLMLNMLSWYDPNMSVTASLGLSNGTIAGSGTGGMVQPIVAKCARIHDLLKKVDFELWRRMEELKIEPQIWGIKWLRLLFSREFPIEESLKLWDAIFAEDMHPTLQITDFVCLAMLIRIRESLLDADYSHFLQGLLRYPLPVDGDARVILLVQQASYLRENCTNFGGAFVRRQNQQLGAEGGVKSGTRAEEAAYERRGNPMSPGVMSKQQQGMTTAALYDQGKTIAEGLYARSEALGINKALFSTLGELKKSVQAYQAQQPGSGFSEIPSRPTWESEPSRNYGLENKRLKAENQAMGAALSASLQMLQAHLQPGPGTDASVNTALSTMQHIRDVLSGHTAHFNPATVAPLVQAAEANLLEDAPPAKVSKTRPPAQQVGASLMDDTLPGMPSTSAFPPLKQPIFQYPAAPARSPKPPASTAMQPNASSSPVLPQVPKHSHQRNSSASSAHIPLPDLGDWQTPMDPKPLEPFAQSSFPRVPPLTRTVHPLDGLGMPAARKTSPQISQRPLPSRKPNDIDPLGVLLR